jgi:hypothetical protein
VHAAERSGGEQSTFRVQVDGDELVDQDTPASVSWTLHSRASWTVTPRATRPLPTSRSTCFVIARTRWPRCCKRPRLTGARTRVPWKTDIATTDRPGGVAVSPFAPTARRVATDPSWGHRQWPTRHNVLHDGPERLLARFREL